MGRADGIHWGTGQSPTGFEGLDDPIMLILAADAPTIMNEPEAQWHYADVKKARPDGLTIWRASPQAKPAERNWDAHIFSRDVFDNIDQHFGRTTEHPTDILLLNELNLDYERGDSKNDGGAFDTNRDNWPVLYVMISQFLDELLSYCKERASDRGFTPRWWYQGWAPGHGEMMPEIAKFWVPRARRYDGIVLHAYTTADVIEADVEWYRETFPNHPLLVGEWNTINWEGPGRLDHEIEIRKRLKQMCAADQNLSACYFIYRWTEDASHEHDIEGNEERLRIWDGTVPFDESTPEVPPVVDNYFPLPVDNNGNEWQATRDVVKVDTPSVAGAYGLPTYVLWAGFMAEAGRDLSSQERWHLWTSEAKDYIAARDKDGLRDILERCRLKGTNDISFGVGHRAWRWSELYNGRQYDLDSILEFRKRMIQDHGYAMHDMARTLSANWLKTGGDPHQTLYLYNKPDGSASDNVKANYDEKLAMSAAEWGLDTSTAPPPTTTVGAVTFVDYTDPMPAGSYPSVPNGCIWHGSRSGKASNPLHAEFVGTANYEVNNPDGLGWTATIGEYEVGVHMSPSVWGWNARGSSKLHLAVEFAQPTVDSPITDGQVEAFCQWWETRVRPIWTGIHDYFPTHAELDGSAEYGPKDGKTDVFPFGSYEAEELRTRVLDRLDQIRGETKAPPPPVTPAVEMMAVERGKWEMMIITAGYLGGDVAQRLEVARASLGLPPKPKTEAQMTKADWKAYAEALEAMIHKHYQEDGAIKDEIIRATQDALK